MIVPGRDTRGMRGVRGAHGLSLWETIVEEEWVILAGSGSWSLGRQRAHRGQT